MAENQDEVVQCLTELLGLAKVAMPHDLFAIDPRVHRARQLIANRKAVFSGSAPTVVPLPDIVELVPRPTLGHEDKMLSTTSPWDITAGLDAFMVSEFAPATRTEAVVLILRDWLIGNGYIEPPPDDEDRH